MDGYAYLQKMIDDRLRDPRGRFSGADRTEIRGVALGLRVAGAMDQATMERAVAELDDRLQRDGILRIVRHTLEGPAVSSPDPLTGLRRTDTTVTPVPDVEPPPRTWALRTVLPLAGRELTLGGHTILLLSLEVWTECLVVHLAALDPSPDRMAGLRELRIAWRAHDDVGTQYHAAGGGTSASGHGIVRVQRELVPGPPDGARELTIVGERDGVTDAVTVPLA